MLLSAYSLVFCCVHQLLFPCLQVLIQGTSPPRAVSCKAVPGCCIEVEHLRVSHADVLVINRLTSLYNDIVVERYDLMSRRPH